ncbi:MAG: HypC/HybG/HupF family hydrogenase formation chaperone [Chitinophagaceae bacterium]|nr:HypC/HybG/HupF family hydrogenase formation chaperone [Chitinophagaceae bacterium]
MCLAIPGKLISVTADTDTIFRQGKVSFGGIIKEVNLSMLPEADVGDYILVHVGVAIGKVDEAEARLTFEYLEKMGETDEIMKEEKHPQ